MSRRAEESNIIFNMRIIKHKSFSAFHVIRALLIILLLVCSLYISFQAGKVYGRKTGTTTYSLHHNMDNSHWRSWFTLLANDRTPSRLYPLSILVPGCIRPCFRLHLLCMWSILLLFDLHFNDCPVASEGIG